MQLDKSDFDEDVHDEIIVFKNRRQTKSTAFEPSKGYSAGGCVKYQNMWLKNYGLTLIQRLVVLFRIIIVFIGFIGILFSLLAINSCNFLTIELSGINESTSSSHQINLGLFGYSLNDETMALGERGTCRTFDELHFQVKPNTWFFAAEVGAIMSPCLALLGCLFGIADICCRRALKSNTRRLLSIAYFLACICQEMTFLLKRFW